MTEEIIIEACSNLLAALESLQLPMPNTRKKSIVRLLPDSLLEEHEPTKRKRSSIPIRITKAPKLTALSSRFQKIRMDDDDVMDIPMDIPMEHSSSESELLTLFPRTFVRQNTPASILEKRNSIVPNTDSQLESRLASMAQAHSLSLSEMTIQWNNKRNELENNLLMISNGVPNDSFQDMEWITKRIMDTAIWMSEGQLEELQNWVPAWKMVQSTIENLVLYVQVIQDIKATVAISPLETFSSWLPSNMSTELDSLNDSNMSTLLDSLNDLVTLKRVLYGNVFKDGALAWKVLGYPVDEAVDKFQEFGSWLSRLILLFLNHFGIEAHLDLDQTMPLIIPILQMIDESIDLIKSICIPPFELLLCSRLLACTYINMMMSNLDPKKDENSMEEHKQSRVSEAKVLHLFEQGLSVLTLLQEIGSRLDESRVLPLRYSDNTFLASELVSAGLFLVSNGLSPRLLVSPVSAVDHKFSVASLMGKWTRLSFQVLGHDNVDDWERLSTILSKLSLL